MQTYNVHLTMIEEHTADVEVQAESEEEAIRIAKEEKAPDIECEDWSLLDTNYEAEINED